VPGTVPGHAFAGVEVDPETLVDESLELLDWLPGVELDGETGFAFVEFVVVAEGGTVAVGGATQAVPLAGVAAEGLVPMGFAVEVVGSGVVPCVSPVGGAPAVVGTGTVLGGGVVVPVGGGVVVAVGGVTEVVAVCPVAAVGGGATRALWLCAITQLAEHNRKNKVVSRFVMRTLHFEITRATGRAFDCTRRLTSKSQTAWGRPLSGEFRMP
jgi:hypothetical protein